MNHTIGVFLAKNSNRSAMYGYLKGWMKLICFWNEITNSFRDNWTEMLKFVYLQFCNSMQVLHSMSECQIKQFIEWHHITSTWFKNTSSFE